MQLGVLLERDALSSRYWYKCRRKCGGHRTPRNWEKPDTRRRICCKIEPLVYSVLFDANIISRFEEIAMEVDGPGVGGVKSLVTEAETNTA